MTTRQQNENGDWVNAKPIPYYKDLRSRRRKLLEFPFRLLGIIRYDPMTAVPYAECDQKEEAKNG